MYRRRIFPVHLNAHHTAFPFRIQDRILKNYLYASLKFLKISILYSPFQGNLLCYQINSRQAIHSKVEKESRK